MRKNLHSPILQPDWGNYLGLKDSLGYFESARKKRMGAVHSIIRAPGRFLTRQKRYFGKRLLKSLTEQEMKKVKIRKGWEKDLKKIYKDRKINPNLPETDLEKLLKEAGADFDFHKSKTRKTWRLL